MSAHDEDTRDESERFAETYAALSADAEQPDDAAAIDDQSEDGYDEDDDEAAASPESDDDSDDDDDQDDSEQAEQPEREPRARRELEDTKRELNNVKSELGRLRPLREQSVQLRAENAYAGARIQALEALLDERNREIIGVWEQAQQAAPDATTRNYYASELALRQNRFQSDRERLDWQSQQQGAQAHQQAQQAHQFQQLDAYVRENAQTEFAAIIQREARAQHLNKDDVAALKALANTREFTAMMQSAPPQQAAQFIQMKATELLETAKQLGARRAKSNRRQAADQQTFRREEPVRQGAKGRPSQRDIERKYKNSGDMAGMYEEMRKHGYM